MKTINIDDFGTRIDKTLVYALNCAQSDAYKVPNKKLDEFINCYLSEYSVIISECIDNNFNMLNNINFTDEVKDKYLKKKFVEKVNSFILKHNGKENVIREYCYRIMW